jgi:hypothetical protein
MPSQTPKKAKYRIQFPKGPCTLKMGWMMIEWMPIHLLYYNIYKII